jgi:UDPglucose 6-dehydrogenase/GDP-mannose 6-dehydrogenase
MNVSIVGAGYVGLVTGLCLADRGHRVTCVDIDAQRVAQLLNGSLPLYEAGLDELFVRHLGKSFFPTLDLARAVHESELTMIAVGTPLEDGGINLQFVADASAAIGGALATKSDYHVVVVKSTVVPGTTDEVVCRILEQASGKKSGRDFGVGMNPEFLREGEAVGDFLKPDRIVLGGSDRRCLDAMDRLYAGFGDVPRIYTNARTAEMIKYASNALLATLISFSNEIGNLCARAAGVDAVDVMHGVHLDRRITSLTSDGIRVTPGITAYLKSGCGFGGSCFPKDVGALIGWAHEHSRPVPLLSAVVETNAKQPGEVIRLLEKHFADLHGIRVAVLGLAFKPGTDDIRESPALRVIAELRSGGADVTVYDPVAQAPARRLLGNERIEYRESLPAAVQDADAVILLTAWPEFQSLSDVLEQLAIAPVVVDGRRVLDKSRIARYEGIGLSRDPRPGARASTATAAEALLTEHRHAV